MTQNAPSMSSRERALARRRAMSSSGKAALKSAADTAQTTRAATVARPAAPTRPSTAPRSGVATGRAASLERRRAMSTRGKLAVNSTDRVRADTLSKGPAAGNAPSQPTAEKPQGDCGCGCEGRGEKRDVGDEPRPRTKRSRGDSGSRGKLRSQQPRGEAVTSPGRAASLARRQAQSSRGKAGIGSNGMTPAQTARATNPQMSGRELARALRDQRSRRGKAGQKKSEPCGRRRNARSKGDGSPGAAQDASWKVGASETSHGQTVTGTMVGRSHSVTGDEPSTCRPVTGTEYLGADIFRDFCQAEPAKAPRRVGVSPTSSGNAVTGNEVGRSNRVTGDEPGTCKNVTGSQYLGANQAQAFCGTDAQPAPTPMAMAMSETHRGKVVTGDNVGRSERVTGDERGADRQLTGSQYMQSGSAGGPAKVGESATLRGGRVSGTMVGRGARMTGDEAGSCRDVTGDDYLGQESFGEFCAATPTPQDQKVGVSRTHTGNTVTGTMTGRGSRVTGDEPGTCKSITGTPYAGAEQYQAYCETPQSQAADARMQRRRGMAGAVMTGQQPALGGVMTGDRKGACEPVSGTPYVGRDQVADVCPATPAEPGSPDFPQSAEDAGWGHFSAHGPSHASLVPEQSSGVTGSRYEQGQITGPFDMASGKVTGTEQARFGADVLIDTAPAALEQVDGRVKARISGEGMDAGAKITGDDWDRGDRVTGTEGTSAKARNPSRRSGEMKAMAMRRIDDPKPEMPEPVSKVTGSSGNTEKGSLITYSGGARG